MLKKNADGTYAHEVLATIKLDRLGCLNIKWSNSNTMFVQFEIDETLENVRYIDGTREDLERGWPCIVGIYDELYAALHGEEE
jgi:hypothetical protein